MSSFMISPDERQNRRKQISASLKDKKYREAFVQQQIDTGLPFQIKALRKKAKLNQKEFGEKLGKPQSVVSRLERPDYGRFNIKTLIEIAAVCDVGLLVAFVPFSELVDRSAGFGIKNIYAAA